MPRIISDRTRNQFLILTIRQRDSGKRSRSFFSSLSLWERAGVRALCIFPHVLPYSLKRVAPFARNCPHDTNRGNEGARGCSRRPSCIVVGWAHGRRVALLIFDIPAAERFPIVPNIVILEETHPAFHSGFPAKTEKHFRFLDSSFILYIGFAGLANVILGIIPARFG